ncbi:MAG: type II/IV secretion system ATPase subunit [Candidatus Thermoplasmatota archaeon]
MNKKTCRYNAIRRKSSKTIIINCRKCRQGHSTIFDKTCRKNIFHILQNEHGATRLILNHAFVKVFTGKELQTLKKLTDFIEILKTYSHIETPTKNYAECRNCSQKREKEIKKLINIAEEDPVSAFLKTSELKDREENKIHPECETCNKKFKKLISKILEKIGQKFLKPEISRDEFYTNYIQPYVRPGFVDSFIQLQPPPDAVFLESYEVKRGNRRPMNVSLYMLKSRPEKLYFVSPSEYSLPRNEIYLLEKVRDHLSQHRPSDTSFMDSETAREYFRHFARDIISGFVEQGLIDLKADRIEYLSDVFSRYTAGFGILEDLLLDQRIQDVYVNAPVVNNALHLVVDGEEYTSNIFLSNADIDALASRFRTLSGRAFSEASPTLDMDLEEYKTRVAAISNPLTPKGIAFALRRHRQKPWTLTRFISNKMLSPLAAGFLSFLVDGQASLLIAGSRGAGKTSLLGSLILEIPQRFRILTLEDTAEIPVDDLQNIGYKIQSLITKSISSGASSTEVSPSDALRTALRLGESVLILGEVRGVEAKVLFEAMRVGAAGNLIMGTIHGSTTRDVYERVVYDIGVPATSFKAVDAIVIAAPIRMEGGIDRKRRVVEISEITKTGWKAKNHTDKVFQDVMVYNTARDTLESTDLLDMGQSQLLEDIARKWGITVEKALQNIRLRAKIKKTIAEKGKEKEFLLEADANRDCNNALWMFIEENKIRNRKVDYRQVEKQWYEWFENYVGRLP